MYIVIGPDGTEHGPVDLATMQTWVSNGNIAPDSQVVDPIDGSLRPAASIPEIARFFPPARPHPPVRNVGAQPHLMVDMSQPYYPTVQMPVKKKASAAILAFLLGGLGIHRFYLGHTGTGIAMLLMTLFGWLFFMIPNVIVGVWVIVDFILILTGGLKDVYGRDLTG